MSRNIKEYHFKDTLPIEIAANTIEQFMLPTRTVREVDLPHFNSANYSPDSSPMTSTFRMKAYEDKKGIELFVKVDDGEETSTMLDEEKVCDALYQTCFVDKDVTDHCKFLNDAIDKLNGEVLGHLFDDSQRIVEGATLPGIGFIKAGKSVYSVIDSIQFCEGTPQVKLNNCVGFVDLNNVPGCVIEFYTKTDDKCIEMHNIEMGKYTGEDTTNYTISADLTMLNKELGSKWPADSSSFSMVEDYIHDRSSFLHEEELFEDEYSDLIL